MVKVTIKYCGYCGKQNKAVNNIIENCSQCRKKSDDSKFNGFTKKYKVRFELISLN